MKLKNNVLILCIVGFSSNIWCAPFSEDETPKPKQVMIISIAGRACRVVDGELKPIDTSLPLDVRYDVAQGQFVANQQDLKSRFFNAGATAMCWGGSTAAIMYGALAATSLCRKNVDNINGNIVVTVLAAALSAFGYALMRK
jgi:hypothetical protein